MKTESRKQNRMQFLLTMETKDSDKIYEHSKFLNFYFSRKEYRENHSNYIDELLLLIFLHNMNNG